MDKDLINFLPQDSMIFPLFQILLLLLFLFAFSQDRLNKGSGRIVIRGKEGWDNFPLAYGIISVILLQIISIANSLKEYKTIITLLDLSGLLYLCFYNSWFRNKIIGLMNKSRNKPENL